MRKIYLAAIAFAAVTLTANAQNLLVVGQSAGGADYDAHVAKHVQVLADLAASIEGITTEVIDADVVTSGTFDFSGYDGIIISESAGSSTISKIGSYTDDVVTAMPVFNMKAYAIHDGKGGWNWCPSADFYTNGDLWDSASAAEQAVMEVTEEHAILSGFSEGDEVQLFGSVWAGGAHFQAFTFDNSAVTDIYNNATPLAVSTVYEEDDDAVTGNMLYAIEESNTSPRNVIWGIHSYFDEPTAAFESIVVNAVKWMMGIEIVGVQENNLDLGVSTYPNPVQNELSLSFNTENAGLANIELIDVTGKTVLAENAEVNAGNNTEMINVKNLAAGIYMVKLSIGEASSTQKIVVE